MIKSFEALDYIQNGRITRRYHNVRVFDNQRVDAHSYGVAQLVRFILPVDVEPERLARLLCAALDHDLPEQVTGDIPAPTKRVLPLHAQVALRCMELDASEPVGMGRFLHLTDEDVAVLKLADAADGCLHCIEERRMGNTNIDPVFSKFWEYLVDLDIKTACPTLGTYIQKLWYEVRNP